mmetsp:Transcript_1804/g.6973  ORF Transcript_1804/g.6973 Transcript_1804/m.6973 type:complete len:244 (+) Transcript_1804:446-1177(+)
MTSEKKGTSWQTKYAPSVIAAVTAVQPNHAVAPEASAASSRPMAWRMPRARTLPSTAYATRTCATTKALTIFVGAPLASFDEIGSPSFKSCRPTNQYPTAATHAYVTVMTVADDVTARMKCFGSAMPAWSSTKMTWPAYAKDRSIAPTPLSTNVEDPGHARSVVAFGRRPRTGNAMRMMTHGMRIAREPTTARPESECIERACSAQNASADTISPTYPAHPPVRTSCSEIVAVSWKMMQIPPR